MKKAISLVGLVIVIIIMIILSSVVIIKSNSSVKDTNKTIFASEILNIQTLVDNYYENRGFFPIGDSVIFNYENLKSEGKTQFSSETTTQFYEVSLQDIGITSVEFGNKTTKSDVYVLSQITGRVYYLEGFEYDGNVYYTIVDELYSNNVSIKVNGKNEIKRYDVIFSLSDIDKTNKPVMVNIKIPRAATISSVITTNNKSVSNQFISGDYVIIKVNESSEDKTGNYDIIVTYTYRDVTKVAKYSVTNYIPEFNLNVSEVIENDLAYITVEITANEANITQIKYETKEITDVKYFENYGRKIKNNKFQVNKGIQYTVYAKDEAGNVKMVNKISGE